MCSVSDIPIVGKALEKISEVTVEFVIREFRYLLCYKSNVNNLNAKIKELEVEEQKMERKVVQERDDANTIEDHVVEWQNDVITIKGEVVDLNTRYQGRPSWRCFKVVRFPNPFYRFGLGREAAKKIERVTALATSGENYLAAGIAYSPRNEHNPISRTKYLDFGSRKDAYSKILEALTEEDGSAVLGIYGMPGVGKTTIMEEAWKQVKEKRIFDEVTLATVSQKVDVIKIQEQLASRLNLHLSPAESKEDRAFRLKTRLENGKRILLIFDDVWDKLPFEGIGIPLLGDGSFKGGKILLTSRKRDVCDRNECKVFIEIGTLEIDEAWDLFRMNVGTSTIGTMVEESLARQVCQECACLPLVIAAVGNALEHKPEVSWIDALNQLRNSNIEDIDGIDSKVYACLQWSFNVLHEDAKSCLLLCSMFPEDAEIPTDILVILLNWSGLRRSFKNLKEARNRVGCMVDTLKSSSLLLEGEDDTVKLHDIIRDVAISIAAKDPYYAFLSKSCGSRCPLDDYSDRKLLFLRFDGNQVHFPDNLECPDLRTLWLICEKGSKELPISFFNGFKSLRFLYLGSVSPATSSLGNLTSLRVLMLVECNSMCDFSSIILLKNLEFLMVLDCSIDELVDLRELTRLRGLYLNGIRLKPHSISCLSNLEELSLPDGVTIWDEEANKAIPVSRELSELTVLTKLELYLEDPRSCLDENICHNLLDFKIFVGNRYSTLNSSRATKILAMFGGSLEGGLKTLLQRSEEVHLEQVTGLRNSFKINNGEAEFVSLTNLSIKSCENVEHLARVLLNHRQIHQPGFKSFSKLSELSIENSSFEYLFEMEEIVRNDSPNEEENEIIDFPKLESMELKMLPNLRSFCSKKRNMSSTPTDNTVDVPVHSLFNGMVAFSALWKLEIDGMDNVRTLFNEKVVFPALEILEITHLIDLRHIWGGKCYRKDSFCQLKILKVEDCNKLKNVIPFAMLQILQKLENLSVKNCYSLISEIEVPDCGETATTLVPFPRLARLSLVDLPEMTQTGNDFTLYPNLTFLMIDGCCNLRNVFRTSGARALVHLEELHIESCKTMEAIIAADENGEQVINGRIEFFPMLKILELRYLQMLNSFWCPESVEPKIIQPASYLSHKVVLPRLEEFKFDVTMNLAEISMSRDNTDDSTSQRLRTLKLVSWSFRAPQVIPLDWLQDLEMLNVVLFRGNGFDLFDLLGHSLQNNNDPYGIPSFAGLKMLRVSECGLSTLFPCSVFRSLQQLEELTVEFGEEIEEIVTDISGDEVTATCEDISIFKLKSIKLRSLPKLKSFCDSAKFAFNMPSLEEVELVRCPQMLNFTSQQISTPSVKITWSKLYNDREKEDTTDDLNKYIQQQIEEHTNKKLIEEEWREDKDEEEITEESTITNDKKIGKQESIKKEMKRQDSTGTSGSKLIG